MFVDLRDSVHPIVLGLLVVKVIQFLLYQAVLKLLAYTKVLIVDPATQVENS